MVLLHVCPPPLELETDWPIKPYCPSNPSLSSPVHRQLTSLGVSSTLASTGLSTFSADIFAGVTSGVEGRYVDATYYCDSNRLAGEDFPDAKKKHPSTVGGRSLRPCAGTWQQREEIRKPHQAVNTKAHHLQKTIQPPVRRRVGTAAVVAAAAAGGLVDDIKQRPKRGSKTAAQPKKTYPSSQSPAAAAAPILGSSCKNRNEHGGTQERDVLHTVYSLPKKKKKKKKGRGRVYCCESRSVGRNRMAGRFRRTNERTNAVAAAAPVWTSCGGGGGGGGHSGTLVWV